MNENGAVVPPNLSPQTFTHFTADNIDINDTSLDGKNTFHATQVAAWQRGPEKTAHLTSLRPTDKTTLPTPEAMQQLHAVDFEEGKSDPVFAEVVELEWYTVDENECDVAQETRAVDMTYIFQRHTKEVRTSWSSFNQCLMSDN